MNLSLPLFDESDDAAVQAGPVPAGLPAHLPVDGPGAELGEAPGHAPRHAPMAPAVAPPVSAAAPADADADWLGPCPIDLPDPLRAIPAAPGPRPATPDPATLHAALWRASQLGGGRRTVTPSGFAALDAQLPGHGWPHGELTELLLPQPGIGELRLLAPALAAIGGGQGPAGGAGGHAGGHAGGKGGQGAAAAAGEGARCVMLFAPPAALSAWALAQQGLNSRHWLVVQARSGSAAAESLPDRQGPGPGPSSMAQAGRFRHRAPRTPSGLLPLLPSADLLWALEQALRSGQVGAVLAWLPAGLRADALRRLQLAAQSHDGPVFLFRESQACHRPSAAPLRLGVQPAGVDGLSLRLFKRRGPPLEQPLRLLLPSVLTPHQQARALALQAVAQAERSAQAAAGASGGGRMPRARARALAHGPSGFLP